MLVGILHRSSRRITDTLIIEAITMTVEAERDIEAKSCEGGEDVQTKL